MTSLDIVEARPEHAAAVAEVIRRSFASRPPLDPPANALLDDSETIAAALLRDGGLVAELDGEVVGTLLFDHSEPGLLGLRRVSVDPERQGHGVASAMVGVAEDTARDRGREGLRLLVREELPDTVRFWLRRSYHRIGRDGVHTVVGKPLPARVEVATAEAMNALASRLAPLLQAGDLLILSGDLGAGKTTFAQGLGDALGVRGPVTSPTFVLSRIHPSLVGGPALVHVDAYRLTSPAEVDDLDLDATMDSSVTAVEWGEGVAEQMSDSRLAIAITGGSDDVGVRRVVVTPHGQRWADVNLRSVLEQ